MEPVEVDVLGESKSKARQQRRRSASPVMSRAVLLLLLLVVSTRALDPEQEDGGQDDELKRAKEYLAYMNREMGRRATDSSFAEWNYASNLTEENLQKKLAVSAENAKFTKQQWKETIKFPWQTYKDPDVKRQFKKYAILGTAALEEDKYEKLEQIVSEMESTYSKAKICDYKNPTSCDLSLEPELVEIMKNSRDPEELKHVWVEWRHVSGEKVREKYQEYVALSNEAAALNNFTDLAEYWLDSYETPEFVDDVAQLWEELRPLYLQLHSYIRRKLRDKYGEEIVSARGPIPAHLLGNMWAQDWSSLVDYTLPYPDHKATDVTPELQKQGYTPLKMFKLSEQFFTSLNLSAMPETFWKNSIIEKPKDRDIICHASAWDFYDGKDFRIKQCTRVNMDDLFTVHHEMGHVQYFIQYAHQPLAFKEGANPGFHEAVGDVMSLSVSTPKHLRRIGLLEKGEDSQQSAINFLFLQGLQKIAFLPSAYMMDLWRWSVFKGKITSDNYNCEWWKLKEQYQGVEPPVDRSEEDFDAGSKYHIISSVPYIRYFVSFVIQFQFHKALCQEAGQFDPSDPSRPLHDCDIYQSTAAGNLLGRMLQMGSSKPWPEAMEALTGQRKMDASGLLDYFRPLQEWLEQENARTGEYIGWEPTKRRCVKSRSVLAPDSD